MLPDFLYSLMYLFGKELFYRFTVRVFREHLSEPDFYGNLVYKCRKKVGKNDLPYHFKKIIVRYKQTG